MWWDDPVTVWPHPRNANELPCALLPVWSAVKSLHRAPLPFKSQQDNDSGAIEIKLDRPCKSLCVNLTHVQKTRRNGVPGKATRGIRLYVSPWNLRATVIYFRLHTNPFNNSSIVLDMKILALDGQPVVSQYCSDSLTQ